MKAALYSRVSTEEQGKSGYSLRQQLEALRRYCNVHDLEVVGEFEDRVSGASLDRPGLDALRDVVSAGGIDLVLCQDRDRLSREPAHHYVLREEFSGYSTALRALNDRGDDSPEGELTDGILDQLAKFERAKTAERTRRGKLRKAQEGKIVGTGKAPYGFYYADDHYHLDQDLMPFVHEIFDRVADGHSLYSTVQHLHKIGAPAPGGGRWHYATLRNIIRNDTYLGTFWWGKKKVTTTTVSMVENGERTYRKKVKREERPREEWTAIPVPDSGIPPETIARARENIEGNTRSVSKNSGRIWELSGGVGVCSECGSRIGAYTTSNATQKRYHYYRCSNREGHACSNRKNYRAEDLELLVKDAIVSTFQPETWADFVNDVCDRQAEDLRKLHRSDPHKTKESLIKRIGTLETKIARARELFIDGDLPRPEYEEKKFSIQDEIEMVRRELSKIDNLDAEMQRIDRLRDALLSVKSPYSGHYAFTGGGLDLDVLIDNNLSYGSRKTAAKRRQEFYRQVGLRVKVGQDVEISLDIGRSPVSKCVSSSCKTPTSRSSRPAS